MKAGFLLPGPKAVLRWIIVAVLGVLALGVAITFAVVAAGKLGLELMHTFEMRLFIATAAWGGVALWAVTAAGLGSAAVLLARKSPLAFWAWLIGFVSAGITQALEMSQAEAAGAVTDPSGAGVLLVLGLMGWGVFVLTWRKPPRLPPR